MSLILAAVCHDVAHPGVNQNFIVNTNHVLQAFRNGDQSSLLERHHFSVGWSILKTLGLLDGLDAQSQDYIKSTLLELILATDISRHRDLVAALSKSVLDNSLDPQNNPSDRTLLMCILMKCADISNPCRPWNLCAHWSGLICEEFFRQGDVERKLGKQVSMFCDRESASIARIQKSFIPHIAQPLFELYHAWSRSAFSTHLLNMMNQNLEKWLMQFQRETPVTPPSNTTETSAGKSPSVAPPTLLSSAADSEEPKTQRTSVADSSDDADDDNDLDNDSDSYEVEKMFCAKRPLFPLSGAARRKYSMPAALLGSSDHSLLVTISSGRASFAADTSGSFQSKNQERRRFSLRTASPHTSPNTVGLGFSLSESRHSEVLKELEKRRFVPAMETVEQSTNETSTTPSSSNTAISPSRDSPTPDLLKPRDEKAQRRHSEQPQRIPISVIRSPTAPVVPLTVYVSAVSHDGSQFATPTPNLLTHRRGSEGTMLSSYVIGADYSCNYNCCTLPKQQLEPKKSLEHNFQLAASQSRNSQAAKNSVSSPVAIDECPPTTPVCRLDGWTRTGKRWSDGCLTVPRFHHKPPLINS